MIKMLRTVVILSSVGGFSGLAMAQDKQGEANGADVSSSLAKLEAQCAHRRILPPDPRDDCARRLRSDAQLGYGQGGGYTSSYSQAAGAGPGIGPGNAGGPGNSLGPGNGGGAGKGGGKGGR
jgi:hypothetical protein